MPGTERQSGGAGHAGGPGLLRLATAGSVDDGKSTLIGRLLMDSKLVYEDHLAALQRDSARRGANDGEVDYALLLDGLKAEREQNITIDVTYRYFSTPRRSFIIADTPGHEQYTRNMATGASTADLAVILVDARHGITTQTRRHSFIMSLLGVRHIVVAVNKMDLAGYDEAVFEDIRAGYEAFAARLEISDIRFIPISALNGDNVVEKSDTMPWYTGVPLLEHLESVHIASDRNLIDLRFPVQYVIRPHQGYRGYAGTIASGIIHPGAEVTVLPGGQTSRVRSIDTADGPLDEAFPPQAVTVILEDEIDVSRGDMLVPPNNLPMVTAHIEAMVIWMQDTLLEPGRQYLVKHTTTEVRGTIAMIRYVVDVNTMHRREADSLLLNDIGRVALELNRPIFADPYEQNRQTGSFIIIDPVSNLTMGAGLVTGRKPGGLVITSESETETEAKVHISRHRSAISASDRAERFNQSPVTVWFTGLPCAGKSTIAYALEKRLFEGGWTAQVLDGDNLRASISRDLDFSADDRLENVRRAAGVANLLNDAGMIVIAAFVSPYRAIRDRAREIIGEERFIEVFVDAPRDICEARDTRGLYEKARRGDITQFTGISAPYEVPESPDLTLNTGALSPGEAVEQIVMLLQEQGVLNPPARRG